MIPGTSTAYQITYSAEVTEYPGSEENLNTMIDSIKLNLRVKCDCSF